MELQRQAETGRTFKRKVYDTLRTMSTAETKPRAVRIMQLQPAIDWSRVWDHLHNVISPDGATSARYMVIHDIIPRNARLRRIRLTNTDKRTQFGRQDTKLNRLTQYGVRQEIWEWNRPRIARLQRTDQRRLPTEWPLRPCFKLWPRRIHQATLCFLAGIGFCVVNHRRTLSVLDCTDFIRRTRWKIIRTKLGCN